MRGTTWLATTGARLSFVPRTGYPPPPCLPGVEPLQQRTLFVGLAIALGIYGIGFVVPLVIKSSMGQWMSFALTLGSLVFLAGWYIAVRRGFVIGKSSRQSRRMKGRKKPARLR